MRIPISAKLIVLTTLLLVSVTVAIAIQSSSYFEKTSIQREESINLDYASAKSNEVENLLSNLVGKTQVSSTLLMKSNEAQSEFAFNFNQEPDMLGIEIYESQAGGSVTTRSSQVKEEEFIKQKVDKTYFTQLKQKMPFPFKSVFQGQIEVLNWSHAQKPSILVVGIPLIKDSFGRITHVAVGYFKLA